MRQAAISPSSIRSPHDQHLSASFYGFFCRYVRVHCARRKEETVRSHFGGNIAIASTSNKAPGRASWGTPIVVLAGGEALFTYLSRTSR